MMAKTQSLENVLCEQRAWAAKDSLDFFSTHRSSAEDLYPSERKFLPQAVAAAGGVLDVGCACGGFAEIMRSFNPAIAYTGIDIMPAMIERARSRYPGESFIVGAAHQLPFRDGSFDLVHCSGVVHLNSDYQRMIAEMWRVTRKYTVFDMRLTRGASRTGSFKVDFAGAGTGGALPYHVVNFGEFRRLIACLDAPPGRVSVFGYRHLASRQANLGDCGEVIMACLCLERGGSEDRWAIDIDGSSLDATASDEWS